MLRRLPFQDAASPFQVAEGLLPGSLGFPALARTRLERPSHPATGGSGEGPGVPAAAPGSLAAAAVHAPVSGNVAAAHSASSPVVHIGVSHSPSCPPLIRCWCDA